MKGLRYKLLAFIVRILLLFLPSEKVFRLAVKLDHPKCDFVAIRSCGACTKRDVYIPSNRGFYIDLYLSVIEEFHPFGYDGTFVYFYTETNENNLEDFITKRDAQLASGTRPKPKKYSGSATFTDCK